MLVRVLELTGNGTGEVLVEPWDKASRDPKLNNPNPNFLSPQKNKDAKPQALNPSAVMRRKGHCTLKKTLNP